MTDLTGRPEQSSAPGTDSVIEQLRRDAADAIGVAPQEISPSDDLTDHGITSLALVSLLEGWADRGIEVDIADFLAEPTLEMVAGRLG